MSISHPYANHVGSNSLVGELLVNGKINSLKIGIGFAERGK